MSHGISILIATAGPGRVAEQVLESLGQQADIGIVGRTSTLVQTWTCLRAFPTDVLLLDSRLLGTGGWTELEHVHRGFPATRVLLLTDSCNLDPLTDAVRCGAKGWLAIGCDVEDYLKAVRAVAAGELWIKRKLVAMLLDEFMREERAAEHFGLVVYDCVTEREREIIHYVVRGMTNKEIAQRLDISDKTVKAHLSTIFVKLGIHRRSGLARYEG